MRIIRIVLDPVFDSYWDGKQVRQYTRVYINTIDNPWNDEKCWDYCPEDNCYTPGSGTKRIYEARMFPGRENLYEMYLDTTRQRSEDDAGPAQDWIYTRWLHKASHVSKSFRDELAQVLWGDIIIQTQSHRYALQSIRHMLEGRPALQKRVTDFHVDLDIPRCFNDQYSMKYLTEVLDLESASFTIDACESDLQKLAGDGYSRLRDYLAQASKLRVSVSFSVELGRYESGSERVRSPRYHGERANSDDGEVDHYDDNGNEIDHDRLINAQYHEVVSELMWPQSLLEGGTEAEGTEEEMYLRSRLDGVSGEQAELGTEELEETEPQQETFEDE